MLQTLAVIGTEFPVVLAREVLRLPSDQLDQLLGGLQMSEFIYEQPVASDVEYRFKHALTHGVAYSSLLTERRRQLHELTGQAIEALYQERLDDHYADLAHHYLSSNNSAKAVEYLLLSGEQAVDRGTYIQASANVESALKLVERLPAGKQRLRGELSVRLLEGRVVPVLHGLASAERLHTCQKVCELSTELRDDSALLRGLCNLGFVYLNSGQARNAEETAARCLALARQNQEAEVLPDVHLLVAWSAYRSGELFEALSRFNYLMKRWPSRPQRVPAGPNPLDPWVSAPWIPCLVQVALGRPDEAVKLGDQCLRNLRQLNQPFAIATRLIVSALIRYWRREPEAMLALAEACVTLAEEHGFQERLLRVAGLENGR